jgi:hypothetical protein
MVNGRIHPPAKECPGKRDLNFGVWSSGFGVWGSRGLEAPLRRRREMVPIYGGQRLRGTASPPSRHRSLLPRPHGHCRPIPWSWRASAPSAPRNAADLGPAIGCEATAAPRSQESELRTPNSEPQTPNTRTPNSTPPTANRLP